VRSLGTKRGAVATLSLSFGRRELGAAALSLPLADRARAQGATGRFRRILETGELRIGVWLGARPWGFVDDRGGMDGSEVTLARRLAADLGLRPILVPLAFSERLPALLEDRVDVLCATMVVLPPRLRQIAFAHPHGSFGVVVVTRRGQAIGALHDLAGRRVAALTGGAAGDSIFRELPPGASLLPVQRFDEAFRALEENRVEAVAVPEFIYRRRLIEEPGTALESAFRAADFAYALAVRHGEHDLLRAINTCVFLWEQEGMLFDLHETFMGGPQPTPRRL